MSSPVDPWEYPTFPEPLAQGLHAHPRPSDTVLNVPRTAVEASCPECGGTDVARYRALSEGGWWNVVKCQACLASIAREPAGLFGNYKPLGLTAAIRFGKETR